MKYALIPLLALLAGCMPDKSNCPLSKFFPDQLVKVSGETVKVEHTSDSWRTLHCKVLVVYHRDFGTMFIPEESATAIK